jgi:hypothetical protein
LSQDEEIAVLKKALTDEEKRRKEAERESEQVSSASCLRALPCGYGMPVADESGRRATDEGRQAAVGR